MDVSTIVGAVSGALATAGLGGAGYLIHRRITEAETHERATLYAVLGELAGQMKQHGISFEEIAALEGLLRKKAARWTQSHL
jgi:hypothetical protein